MTDFAKLAREARERHEAQQSDAARLKQEKADAEALRLRNAQTALFHEVRPTLEQAKQAFASEGITAVIDEFEGKSVYTRKDVWVATFKCCNRRENTVSSTRLSICGNVIRFEHDGSSLTIIDDSKRYSQRKLASVDEAVVEALDSFYNASGKAS